MKYLNSKLFSSVVLGFVCFRADADLVAYNANGVDLVHMSNVVYGIDWSNLSWTKDGNLLGTMQKQYAQSHGGSYAGLVNAIINSSQYNGNIGQLYDYYYGVVSLSESDFSDNGAVSYWGGIAFIHYLNAIKYAGSQSWGFPLVTDIAIPGCMTTHSGVECGFQNSGAGQLELSALYYFGLQKKGEDNGFTSPDDNYGIFDNNGLQTPDGAVGPFTNVQSSPYWFTANPLLIGNLDRAFNFATGGGEYTDAFNSRFYVWPFAHGRVSAVPVPGAFWLMMGSMLSWLGLRGRRLAEV